MGRENMESAKFEEIGLDAEQAVLSKERPSDEITIKLNTIQGRINSIKTKIAEDESMPAHSMSTELVSGESSVALDEQLRIAEEALDKVEGELMELRKKREESM